MPVIRHKIKGYRPFKKLVSELHGKKELVIAWFSGAVDEDGKSWCSDCVEAEPVIEEYLTSFTPQETVHIVYTEIERDEFKSKDCPFRTDDEIKLEKLPSVMGIEDGDQKKCLLESECKDKALLERLFGGILASVTSHCTGDSCGIRKKPVQ